MNIYVVIENQFPDSQLIMICQCDTDDQAVTAYERLWLPADSHISACIKIAECNAETPAILWKNFLNEEDDKQSKTLQNASQEDNTSDKEEDSTATTEQAKS